MAEPLDVRTKRHDVSPGCKRTRGKKSLTAKQYPNAKYLFPIIVCGYPIHVYSTANLSDDTTVGEYRPDGHEIFIKSDLGSPEIEADVLLHELTHAISYIAMVEEDRMSERQTNALATTLADTLRRNKWLKRWLLERL